MCYMPCRGGDVAKAQILLSSTKQRKPIIRFRSEFDQKIIITMNKSNVLLRLSIVFLLLAGVTYNSSAQFGIRAGAIFSKEDVKGPIDVQNFKSKAGLDLAVTFGIPIGNVIALQPELHFIQKGSKIENVIGGGEDIKVSLNYLELPMLLKLSFGGDELNVFGLAGPSIGYLSGGSIKFGEIKAEWENDDYENFELGAHFGAGVRFGNLAVDLRYLVGFSDNRSANENEAYNRGISAGLSLLF